MYPRVIDVAQLIQALPRILKPWVQSPQQHKTGYNSTHLQSQHLGGETGGSETRNPPWLHSEFHASSGYRRFCLKYIFNVLGNITLLKDQREYQQYQDKSKLVHCFGRYRDKKTAVVCDTSAKEVQSESASEETTR